MLTLGSSIICLASWQLSASAPQTFHWTLNGSSAAAPPLLNPNRGFRMQISNGCLPGKTGQEALEEGIKVCKLYNMTVTLFYCYISRFWNISQFPEDFLHADLPLRFATLRQAGISAVMNFAYMDGKTNFSNDVQPYSFEMIRGHITQLAPVIRANADVVHSLQAGFIGNAGEWAHDIRNLTSNHTGLAGMVAQLAYDVLGTPPVDRFVHIRRPLEKMDWLLKAEPSPPPKAAASPGYAWGPTVVNASSAHSMTASARLGLYNAGFLSTVTDGGTFSPPIDDRNPWFRYMTLESPFLAVDGECYYGTPWPSKGRLLVDGMNASARMTQHRCAAERQLRPFVGGTRSRAVS